MKVTKGIFKAIKILLDSGESQTNCAEQFDLSRQTMRLINMSETYEEYKHNSIVNSTQYKKKMAAIKAKDNEAFERDEPTQQVANYKPTIQIQATHYMMEELRKQNELLAGISNKLAFIVEELTGKKV